MNNNQSNNGGCGRVGCIVLAVLFVLGFIGVFGDLIAALGFKGTLTVFGLLAIALLFGTLSYPAPLWYWWWRR